MVRPAVGNLELPCWTIICGSVGAVVFLAFTLLTAAGLSGGDEPISLALPVCPIVAGALKCTAMTSAQLNPCDVTCPVQNLARYYVQKCEPMKNGAMYAQCMSKSGPDFNKTADLAADYSDGTYCDKQERTHADRHCYPVADAHIVASDPDSTFDKQTAWETLYHLAGGVNGNRCGYLTYRDLAVVHNCHPEAFGCAETATAGDPYVNFKAADLSAAGTPVGKKVMAGTGANTGKAAKTYTTCIRRSEISCGDGSGAAPAGWSWADLLPKPFTGDMRDTPFTYSQTRIACPGSSAEALCDAKDQRKFSCLMGIAPLKGGWRDVGPVVVSLGR